MADGYRIRAAPHEALFSIEQPAGTPAAHPYLAHQAVLGLFNATGSGRVVKLRAAAVSELAGRTAAAATTRQLVRITGHTPTADVIAAQALDSAAAALPAQMVLCRMPAAIATTGSQIDEQAALPLANIARAAADLASARCAPLALAWRWQDAATAQTQRIVLREGEGLAMHAGSGANGHTYRVRVAVLLRIAATGACYLYSFAVAGDTRPLWSLVNGAGSGVVAEVAAVSVAELGTDETPQLTLERIDAMDGGTPAEVTALDTAAPLPATVTAAIGPAVQSQGAKSGALIVVPQQIAQALPPQGVGPGLAGVALVRANVLHGRHALAAGHAAETAIVLREGEGLAVLQRTGSGVGRHEIALDITVEAAAAGGGSTYARGRAVHAA